MTLGRALNSPFQLAALLAGVLALGLSYVPGGAPYITNDGYQYLDAASNLVAGRCFCTRVALFDEQVALGRLPVPFTHFAPGYPLLIAALSRTGLSEEMSGYLISAAGFIAVIWLMWDIGLRLGARQWVLAVFTLMWITSATALLYASMVGSESLFTALLLGVVALILRDLGQDGGKLRLPVAIGVVAALSYWIRYPGLFVVAAAGFYLIASAWQRPAGRRGAVSGLLAAGALTAAIQLRNAVYTGSWRGGFKNSGNHSPLGALVQTARAFSHFVTGDRAPLRPDVWMALLLASLAALLFFGVQEIRRSGSHIPASSWAAPGWTLFVAVAYTGGVFVATLVTIAGDLPRYYFPIYPLLLVLVAVGCSPIAQGRSALALILFVASATVIQGRSLFVPPTAADWVLTRSILDEPAEPGVSLTQWLRRHVPPDDVIVAVEGQALHYVVQRPVVAVIPPQDSQRAFDEAGYEALMRQYRSAYLVVFPHVAPTAVPEQEATPFLRDLASGVSPAWLKLAAHTRQAAVYKCESCKR